MDDRRGAAAHVRGLLAGGVYEAKTIVARHRGVALPIGRLRDHGEVSGDGTEIVIESFPRSASTFAVAAFRLAQEPRAMSIAHHTHMPAQVLEGVRRGLPTLVLIREPEAVLVSHLIRSPDLPEGSATRGFVRFYEPIEPVLSEVVVGTFEQVVGAFGSVIERIDDRFGTGFQTFEPTPANVERIEGEIEDDYRRHVPATDLERTISRPSSDRDARAAEVRERLGALRGGRAWERAQELYRVFAAAAGA